MSHTQKKPWTIGEQIATVVYPARDGAPESEPLHGLVLNFTSDPDDSSIKRLRITSLNEPEHPAIECTFKGGDALLEYYYQAPGLKPWNRDPVPPKAGDEQKPTEDQPKPAEEQPDADKLTKKEAKALEKEDREREADAAAADAKNKAKQR